MADNSNYGKEKGQPIVEVLDNDPQSDDASVVIEVFKADKNLHRGLYQRHIQMVALVGVMGTGLFLYSGGALQQAGPVGMLLAYLVVAFIVSCNQVAMAETSALMPTSASGIRQAKHFVDGAAAFALGWVQVWSAVMPSEYVAAAVVVGYWSDLSPAVWITIFIVLSVISNSWSIRVYGELQFFFATLKILLILGLILVGLIIDLGGVPGQKRLGFHYWRDPGPWASFMKPGAAGRAIGFFSVLNGAVYSFGGVQSVPLLAGETQAPRRNIPKAAKRIIFRTVGFYLVTLFIVSLIVPYTNQDISNAEGNAAGSPFVVAMQIAGIKVLPSIINAVVLTSAWSAANEGIVTGSRVLFSLAANGEAPKIFLRTNKRGLPYVGMLLVIIFLPLAYMTLGNTAAVVFGYMVKITSSILLVNWIMVSLVHYRLNRAIKAQGYSRSQLPYTFPYGQYLGPFSGIASTVLLLIGGFTTFIQWSTSSFVGAYLAIPIFFSLFTFWKLFRKTRWLRADEIDLKSLFLDVELHPEPEPEPLRGWRRLEFLWA